MIGVRLAMLSMKLTFALMALIATLLVSTVASAEDAPSRAFPPHTIPNSQLRVLRRNSAGRQYQLHIGLPESYAKSPTKRYPGRLRH